MKNQIRTSATVLLLLLASIGFSAAADSSWMAPKDRLTLSGAQELAILQSLSRQGAKRETAPSGFEAEIGQPIPKSITLHKLPSDAVRQVPTVEAYNYARLRNDLLIVNPHDRIAVDVIAGDVASN
jgi:Protein of unknown function (DUF1236)